MTREEKAQILRDRIENKRTIIVNMIPKGSIVYVSINGREVYLGEPEGDCIEIHPGKNWPYEKEVLVRARRPDMVPFELCGIWHGDDEVEVAIRKIHDPVFSMNYIRGGNHEKTRK